MQLVYCRCSPEKVLGMLLDNGAVEIRHRGRTVIVEGARRITVRCEVCRQPTALDKAERVAVS